MCMSTQTMRFIRDLQKVNVKDANVFMHTHAHTHTLAHTHTHTHAQKYTYRYADGEVYK